MQRFNDRGFVQPRYGYRPVANEIRIPVRTNTTARPTQADQTAVQDESRHAQSQRPDAVDWKDKYARLMAERENERKRLERLYSAKAAQEKEQVLRDMLPLADNLERALAHTQDEAAEVREGTRLTLKAFMESLAKHGVEPIEARGKQFDPNLHEAVGVIPHPTLPAGTIAAVEETGYTLQGNLLRPARVLVAAG